MRQVTDGLHVVDHGRLPVEALDRRKGRLESGLAPVSLQRGQQGGLLSADVRAGAPVEDDIDVVTLTQHVLAKVACLPCLVDGGFQRLCLRQVLTPDIDEGEVTADRIAGDQDPLQHLVRAPLDQVAILETTGFTLIRVADQVARIHPLGQETPLVSGRKSGPAAAPQAAFLHQLHQLVGLHLERPLETGIPAGFLVDR